jgi:hypothetical protein
VSAAEAALASVLEAKRPGSTVALAASATLDEAAAFDPVRFELVFAAAGRRLGTTVLGGDATVADEDGVPWSIAGWGVDELARAWMVLRAVTRLPAADQVAWLEGLYRAAALRERQAVLRVLALLPDRARFLAIAGDAGRSSTQPIFEALAADNPYPAACFPDASFAQLVMKALFTGLPLARILGLHERRTPELARMAADYARERAAAGRAIPADLARLTEP